MQPGKSKSTRKSKGAMRREAREAHPSPAQPTAEPGEESESNCMTEEDAEALLLALFGGKPWRYTPSEEIAKDCPAVWQCALQVFGNRAVARKWLETSSPAFQGKCPYNVSLQVGGEQKVLRELKRFARARSRHARGPNKRPRK